ncbi:protein Rae1-like [Onthophagus taurus]|uniref:protein Rae1-like n=1 Tax=Onthophagus taurus TaxID=166361 RepID=UPI000C20502D|nr:mRNA export factor-like [Onthophagus taurus]
MLSPTKYFELTSGPKDSVSCLEFSPSTLLQNFLVAGSWDHSVRCWDVEQGGKTVLKSKQTYKLPVVDVSWSDDGSKVFMAGCDREVKVWDLGSNQTVHIGAHKASIETCHWFKGSNYSCLMTGSWDKTLKFWDIRSPSPMMSIRLPEYCYCADVDYPFAVVATAGRKIIVYRLEGKPQQFKTYESQRCEHKCIALFRDEKQEPAGYALGYAEGRVAIQHLNSSNPSDNFVFKCHSSQPVNNLAFHPVHGTLATVGFDGAFNFWNKDTRTALKTNWKALPKQSITRCAFNHDGQIFAYTADDKWSMEDGYSTEKKKQYLFLRSCKGELKSTTS